VVVYQQLIAAVTLADPSPGPDGKIQPINTNGILMWMASNALPILIGIVAICVITAGIKGQDSVAFRKITVTSVGVVLFAFAGTAHWWGPAVVSIIVGG
jgi:uncharacterized membrane protein